MLRKERIHHSGASNLSNRWISFLSFILTSNSASKRLPQSHPSLDTTSKTSPSKSSMTLPITPQKTPNSFDIIHKKASRSVFAPQDETARYYEESHRPIISKTKIGNLRSSNLEEKDKMKTVFTGESALLYDRKFNKYREDKDVQSPTAHLPCKIFL